VSFLTNAMTLLSPSTSKFESSVIVTLFEGEPYTLWNIRDLARHCGLEVERSFGFQWGAYPGYRHARTLGVIKGKDGNVGGGWRGEERAARTFVFVRRGEGQAKGRVKRRKSSSDSEHEEDESHEKSEMEVDIQSIGNEESEDQQEGLR
jgi:25S rRNA (uracil2634-N3)-methyltransferase